MPHTTYDTYDTVEQPKCKARVEEYGLECRLDSLKNGNEDTGVEMSEGVLRVLAVS